MTEVIIDGVVYVPKNPTEPVVRSEKLFRFVFPEVLMTQDQLDPDGQADSGSIEDMKSYVLTCLKFGFDSRSKSSRVGNTTHTAIINFLDEWSSFNDCSYEDFTIEEVESGYLAPDSGSCLARGAGCE